MARCLGLRHHELDCGETTRPAPAAIEAMLARHPEITHLAMVHCETTTGMLNPLEEVAALCQRRGIRLIVDAMSSFGGIPIDMGRLGIEFLISSANKCIQGCRVLVSSSLAAPHWRPAPVAPARSPSTCMPSGRPWSSRGQVALYLAHPYRTRLCPCAA